MIIQNNMTVRTAFTVRCTVKYTKCTRVNIPLRAPLYRKRDSGTPPQNRPEEGYFGGGARSGCPSLLVARSVNFGTSECTARQIICNWIPRATGQGARVRTLREGLPGRPRRHPHRHIRVRLVTRVRLICHSCDVTHFLKKGRTARASL